MLSGMSIPLIVALFASGLLGAALVGFLMRGRARAARQAAEDQADSAQAALVERLRGHDELLVRLRGELEGERSAVRSLRERNGDLGARLETERAAATEKLAYFETSREQLTDAFKALSSDALDANADRLMKMAEASLDQRSLAIDAMMKPVRETLTRVDGKIDEVEKSRKEAYGGITEQLKQVRETQTLLETETRNLVNALRTPHVRGSWGEVQLRQVVELAGMLEYCDFVTQETLDIDERRLRPDLIVRMPGGKNVIVDSKAPMVAYLEAHEAPDDEARDAALQRHAGHLRKHILQLSAKSYQDGLDETPEFVVLFLPAESIFSAALRADPSLFEEAARRDVVLATPTTLIALLRTIHQGWRHEQLAHNAREISELGRELYSRLRSMGGHFADVRKGLDRAVQSYNKAVGSLENRVMVTARKFEELGAAGSEELEPLEPTDRVPRLLQSTLFDDEAVDEDEDEDPPGHALRTVKG